MTNHTPPTDEELAEMQARCDAATPGPWSFDDFQLEIRSLKEPLPANSIAFIDELRRHESDGEFIAHSRTDLPRVLADNKRLRGIIRLDWEAKTKPLIDDSEASERLDASDFNLRVGANPK